MTLKKFKESILNKRIKHKSWWKDNEVRFFKPFQSKYIITTDDVGVELFGEFTDEYSTYKTSFIVKSKEIDQWEITSHNKEDKEDYVDFYTNTIFVYGTLKKGFKNHIFLDRSIYLGKGCTNDDFTLYVDGLPYMTEEKDGGGVIGEIYMVDDKTLKDIDILECHPHFYERKTIQILTNKGKKIEVYAYIVDNNLVNKQTSKKAKLYT